MMEKSHHSLNSIVKKTNNIKLDLKTWKRISLVNKDYFFNPFEDWNSYLYMYKDRPSCVEFYPLQRLNYNGDVSKEAELQYRYLCKTNPDKKEFLEKRKKTYTIELNEANWNQELHPFLSSLPGEIRRARLLKLPAHSTMPFHRDETRPSDIRVVCPIITSSKVKNLFKVEGKTIDIHLPSDGSFYSFDERLEHSVVNDGSVDRYVMVFTVLNTTIEEWDDSTRQRNR